MAHGSLQSKSASAPSAGRSVNRASPPNTNANRCGLLPPRHNRTSASLVSVGRSTTPALWYPCLLCSSSPFGELPLLPAHPIRTCGTGLLPQSRHRGRISPGPSLSGRPSRVWVPGSNQRLPPVALPCICAGITYRKCVVAIPFQPSINANGDTTIQLRGHTCLRLIGYVFDRCASINGLQGIDTVCFTIIERKRRRTRLDLCPSGRHLGSH